MWEVHKKERKTLTCDRDGDGVWAEKSGEKGSRLQNVRRSAGFESPPPYDTNNPNTTTMKGSKSFEERIKSYLDQRAEEDPLFAERYGNPKKSIEKCCEYILGEVSAAQCCGYDDDEIFGMAVHYYDEDDIQIKPNKVDRVVVNQHIELTDEEKAEARQEAIKAYQKEVIDGMKKKPAPKPKEEKTEESQQLNLF